MLLAGRLGLWVSHALTLLERLDVFEPRAVLLLLELVGGCEIGQHQTEIANEVGRTDRYNLACRADALNRKLGRDGFLMEEEGAATLTI